MKKLILLPLLFSYFLAASQGSRIEFEFQNDKPHAKRETSGLKLPLILTFSKAFNGKSVSFFDEEGKQVIALGSAKFGSGTLTKDGETDSFRIEIKADGKVNPGDEKINVAKFTLQIEQEKISLALAGNSNNDNTNNNAPLKAEEYIVGYIYYDALKLVDKNTSSQTKIEILNAYKVDATKNPYLKEIKEQNEAEIQGGGAAAFFSSLGNTDVTYFAAGLARFLAERTKEELNEAFFSKMKKQLNAYPELKTAFPKTASFLDIIETYSYASIIQVLKEAFETDVQNLPDNLYNLKNLDETNCNSAALKKNQLTDCQARLEKLKLFFESQYGRWIGLGMFTVKESFQASNPAALLKSITESDELAGVKKFSKDNSKYTDYNVAASIELSNLISQSLISKTENQVWVNPSDLTSLFKIKDAFKAYLGLLLAHEQMEASKTDFYKSDNRLIEFQQILVDNYGNFQDFQSLIKNSYTAFNATNNAVKKMISATDRLIEADPQSLYDYYKTFTASLKPIARNPILNKILGYTTDNIGVTYDKIEQYLNPSVDMAYHISTKKYSAAIYDATILLSNLKTTDDKYKPVIKSFVKYGTLISTVASAQSSDEVKKALEASVLPVGSSSIKRNSAWSISINSYVGGFWGKAKTDGQDTIWSNDRRSYTVKNSRYTTFGLYAPIGVSFSLGSKWGGGISLTPQLLDLGALVNFYLLNGDETALPQNFTVRLSNIFAPGGQIGFNIPKTPLTLAVGGQFVPALYKTDQISTTSEIVASNAFRWHGALVVDIPMYNIKVGDFRK